jgi:hypothetical protein
MAYLLKTLTQVRPINWVLMCDKKQLGTSNIHEKMGENNLKIRFFNVCFETLINALCIWT